VEMGLSQFKGLIEVMPHDGLQVGRDEGSLVGEYSQNNRFAGSITNLRISI
jgi:hypothetical protein